MKKRFLSIALALCMLLSIVPMTPIVATAETVTPTTVVASGTCGATESDSVTWELSSDGTMTIDGSGNMKDFKQKYIGEDYFHDDCPWKDYISDIKSVVICDGVTSIGDASFFSCSNLTSVTFGKDITEIGWSAFERCTNLKNVDIPDGVTMIGNRAFEECSSLTKITIPKGVTRIESLTFFLCTVLSEVVITEGVTEIGQGAFYRCTALSDISIPNSVTSIENMAFYACTALSKIVIPGNVSSVGEEAFRDCTALTDVTFGGDVNKIQDNAFHSCTSLKTLIFKGDVAKIGKRAFGNCSGLTDIYLFGEATGELNDYNGTAFNTCFNLSKVYYYDDNTTVGTFATHMPPFDIGYLNGTCGATESDSVTWKLKPDGTLVIDGNGTAADYSSTDAPWKEFADKGMIKNVTIGKNVAFSSLGISGYSLTVSSEAALKTAVGNDGTVILGDNITIGSTLIIEKEITLDLNGYTLKYESETDGSVINVIDRGSLKLEDSSSAKTGTVTGGHAQNGGGVYVETLNYFGMYGGTISGCTATQNGGGVYIRRGDFIMYGGTVSGCTATQNGGGLYIDGYGGMINLYSGAIIGCTATQKGDVIYVVNDSKLLNEGSGGIGVPTTDATVCYGELCHGGTVYGDGKIIEFKDGNDLYAWEVVTYDGSKAVEPIAPQKTGYTFKGWYHTEGDIKERWNFDNPVLHAMTLSAEWSEDEYTVSFDTDGGTDTDSVTVKWTDTILDGVSEPEKDGFIFAGWKYDVYDVTDETTLSDLVTDSTIDGITVHAVWEINQYTITVKPTNGNKDITIKQDYGTTVAAPTLTRDGYEFDGWDKTFPTTMPAEDMTITAKWKDVTAPTGEIKLGTNSWKTFLNNITFGLFFKETQEVTITATDNSGELVTIEYLLSDKELMADELATATFTAYSDKFSINPNNEYVIYAKLTDTTGNVTYINSNGIVLDNVAPIITGITNGKTYCEAQTVTVSDKYEVTVTVNGTPVTLDANGQFILTPTSGTQTVVATDKAGNVSAEMIVTVNDGHTYEWQNENGQYWQECQFCGDETAKKDIPAITINGADKVCVTQGYRFTVAVPEGVTDVTYGYEFEHKGDGGIELEFGNGAYYDTIPTDVLMDETSFKLLVAATTADGYIFSASKNVQILLEHTGGTATCKDKAVCEVCVQPYGEVDSNNHDLENIPAKDATVTETGNTEYWHCKDCDNNFSDKDGKNVIDLKDTVISKLAPEIIDGKGQSLTAGEKKELTFRSNAAYSDFIRVEVDGKTVDGKNYTVKEGSTIVTLKSDYVATLSVGEHTLGIVSTGGTATTAFTVNAKVVNDNTAPQTGDNSHMTLWFALLFVSGGALIGTAVYGKKRKRSAK